jgi:hypothetical protein
MDVWVSQFLAIKKCQNDIHKLIIEIGLSEQHFSGVTGLSLKVLHGYPDFSQKQKI